jgi:hypothetical protein
MNSLSQRCAELVGQAQTPLARDTVVLQFLLLGPGLPTVAMQQVVGNLRYTGHQINVLFVTAAAPCCPIAVD